MTERSGRRPRRAVDGIVLLDKPEGMSSNAALQAVKRLYHAKKAGHTGSLDPLATGLLPLCLGEATKFSAHLLDADKRYRAVCRLGTRTATGDREGEVTETRPVPAPGEAEIEKVLAGFRGVIRQIPPMYSALKHQGRRLYELAREGREVERPPREVTIHELRCTAFEGDRLTLEVRCSKGTYVRTLAEDIAAALGTVGHLESLRRTGAGPYTDADMHDLDELRRRAETGGEAALDACLLGVDTAVADWPELRLDADSAWYLGRGQAVLVPGAPTAGAVRLYARESGRFLGIGRILDDGRVAPRRLLAHPEQPPAAPGGGR